MRSGGVNFRIFLSVEFCSLCCSILTLREELIAPFLHLYCAICSILMLEVELNKTEEQCVCLKLSKDICVLVFNKLMLTIKKLCFIYHCAEGIEIHSDNAINMYKRFLIK